MPAPTRLAAARDLLARDLWDAWRRLVRSPGFAAAALLALALGIGANAAIFCVADAVLARPLPYAAPERLTVLLHRGDNPVAPANYLDWRREMRAFADMAAAEAWSVNLAPDARRPDDRPEKLWALRVTPNMFALLGVRPLLGRALEPDDDRGDARVVVMSHALWRRRFASDPSVVGRAVSLDGERYTIVGVMPEPFRFAPFWATRAELWSPLPLAARAGSRTGASLRVFARLAPGATLAAARAEVAAVTARLEREFPGTNRDVRMIPLAEKVSATVRPALLILLGAVTFVLLVACTNVAHLQLARAVARRPEIALRTALGATRGRLVRQLLVENLLVALLGGLLALGVAWGGVRALVALAPEGLARVAPIAIDARVVGYLALVSALAGLAFGLVPALEGSSRALAVTLRGHGRGAGGGAGSRRLRAVLVASEIALALVLMVGAGLMVRSFRALRDVDPGFRPDHVLTMTVSVKGSASAAAGVRPAFYRQAVARVAALPGVRAASAINHLPIAGDVWGTTFTIAGRPTPAPGDEPRATYRVVLPGYFRTMGIPLLRGRDVSTADDSAATDVVVIDQYMARRWWPGEDPIGRRVAIDRNADGTARWRTIVGIAHDDARAEWGAPPEEELFVPYLQQDRGENAWQFSYLTLVARTTGDPAAMAGAARDAVWSVDRGATIAEVQTMEHVAAGATADTRFDLFLLGAFAATALLLAALGVYGVMSQMVARRTRELGIRIAVGAAPGEVLRLVVGESMRVAVAGCAAGALGALLLGRWIAALLYRVDAADPATFVGAVTVVLGAALVASWGPARRAARVDPVVALRAD